MLKKLIFKCEDIAHRLYDEHKRRKFHDDLIPQRDQGMKIENPQRALMRDRERRLLSLIYYRVEAYQ